MEEFENCPLLESTLSKLLNKTEKNWGYLQIEKKEENIYVLRLAGSDENMLTLYFDENHLFRLYWYSSSQSSVSVEAKINRFYNKTTGKYRTEKVYKVGYKETTHPIQTAINKRFAQLIREKITDYFRSQLSEKDTQKIPSVLLVAL
ncbi:hypothetical protein [Kamptonema formosum]|uniref:hypothetical protein n=1 Tax=Kamptonema formosum TaxID=331992 RepID=UPI0003476F08|nr:hypothetical protein [Oscillatoria sp. PCC 10802]